MFVNKDFPFSVHLLPSVEKFTASDFQGHYNACSKWLKSHILNMQPVFAAMEFRHCMLPFTFHISQAASPMFFNNCGLPSALPLWYIPEFTQLRSKKSNAFHPCGRAGQHTVLSFQTISLLKFHSKFPSILWRNVLVSLYVVLTFPLVLQYIIPVERDDPFSENFCNAEL